MARSTSRQPTPRPTVVHESVHGAFFRPPRQCNPVRCPPRTHARRILHRSPFGEEGECTAQRRGRNDRQCLTTEEKEGPGRTRGDQRRHFKGSVRHARWKVEGGVNEKRNHEQTRFEADEPLVRTVVEKKPRWVRHNGQARQKSHLHRREKAFVLYS